MAAGVAGVAGVLASSVSTPAPAAAVPANHGSWTAHTYVLTDPSPSSYSLYGRTAASQPHDFSHAYIAVYRDAGRTKWFERSATCGQASEGCIDTRTSTTSFSQGYFEKRITYLGCAFDVGTHVLEGPIHDYAICAKQGWSNRQLTGAHHHVSVPFS